MSIHGREMKRLFILLLMSSMLFGASVKVRINGTEVVEDSALELQIIAEGKDIEFPDIQDIGGFRVEGSRISSKLESSYINGKFSSKSIKTLRFSFYPEMDMTIPAFAVKIEGKQYHTKPIEIHVVKPSAVTAKSVDGYTLRIKANKTNVYVGEPFIATVDFFEPRNSSVTKVEYTPPKFKNFFSQTLGEERLRRTATGTIHELQYLVSPKKEGNLTVMPPKARIGIRSFGGADRDPWGFFANDIQWHSVRAKALSVNVKALPEDTDLVGIFKIESSIDHMEAKPNHPVTYTLKIFGEGNLDDMADPKFDMPGVTIYGDDAKVTSKVSGEKVISQYERKYVFISDKDFVIPSLVFKSFDYLSKKSKKLTTKAYKIKINAHGVSSNHEEVKVSKPNSSTTPTKLQRPQEETHEQNKSILEDTAYYAAKKQKNRTGYSLWIVLLAFVVGSLSTVFGVRLYRFIKQRKGVTKQKYYSTQEALKILYPHTNHNKKVEAMVRKLYEIENGNRALSIDKKELSRMIEQLRHHKKEE